MKWIYYLSCSIVLFSCSTDEAKEERRTKEEEIEKEQMSLDESIVRYLESALRINGTEDYSYNIYEADCDGDDSLDLVITVNLLQRALNQAKESNNVAKRADVGYMGNFNYVIYMDGLTKKFSLPSPIASSPHAELKVSFERIVKNNCSDILIDYRVRNSGFRDFFTISNKNMIRTLQLKIFDGIGDPETESFIFEYQDSPSGAKDVVVYKGTFENITLSDPDEVYSFEPEISSIGELERRWFYNPREGKYFTQR